MAFGLGENVGRAYVSLHANGDEVPDEISDALDRMTPAFKVAGEKHSKAYTSWFQKETNKGVDRFLTDFRDQLHEGLQEQDAVTASTDRMDLAVRRLTDHIADNDETTHRWLTGFHNKLVGVNEALDRSATRTGKIFGAGSRNDFLNLVGRSVEGLNRLILVLPKAAEGITGLFSGEGGGGLDMAKIASNFAAGLVGIVLGVTALISIAGPVATLITGISAAIIGLVASLTFAAGAVGGVALALAGPLVAGIGVAVLALTHLDKQADASFQKILDNFNELGDVAGKAIGPGLARAAELSAPALEALKPLVEDIAEALGEVAVGWAKAINSPAFGKFRNAMEDFLPDAIERLGEATGNVFGAIGGVIRGAIPITEDFLDWLVKITDQFEKWTNSRAGQRELRDFFERAAESAKAVGGFILDAVDATAKLLSAGKDSGDTIFEKMGDQLERFVGYLTDPANQAAIEDFFANGIEVAQLLGKAILEIAEAIADLDTPESRAFLESLFDIFATILDVLITLTPIVRDLQEAIATVYGTIIEWIVHGWMALIDAVHTTYDAIADFFGKIPDKADHAVDAVTGFFKKLPGRVIDAISSLPGRAEKLIDKIAYQAGLTVGRTIRFFATLPGRVMSAIAELPGRAADLFRRVVERATEISQGIIDWFSKLPDRIDRGIGNLWSSIGDRFTDVVDKAGDVVGDIVDAFSGLAGKILNAIGTIDIGSLIKIPGGALGSAVDGVLAGLSGDAAGDIVTRPRLGWTGEAGPEAIVPLNRPLSQVNPNVRGLSAIAQGLAGGGSTIEAGAIVINEAADGRATAAALLNALVARAY